MFRKLRKAAKGEGKEEMEIAVVKPEKKKKKKIKKRYIALALLVVLIGGNVVYSMLKPEVLPVVNVEAAFKGDVSQTLDVSGVIESENKKTYYSPVTAQVEECNVETGKDVATGESLVSFSISDIENQYRQGKLQQSSGQYEYQEVMAKGKESATDLANSNVEINDLNARIDAKKNEVNALQNEIRNFSKNQADKAANLAKAQAELAGVEGEIAALRERAAELEKDNQILSAQLQLTSISEEDKVAKEILLAANIKELEEIPAQIESKMAQLGELSTRVQSLSATDTTDLEQRLGNAQSELAELQGELGKQESVKAQSEAGILSDNRRKQLAVSNELAAVSTETAEEALEKAKAGISAEFGGIITDLQIQPGAIAAAGQPLFTIQSDQDVKVVLSISKYEVENIELGQAATITFGKHTYEGNVTKISRVAEVKVAGNSGGVPMVQAEVHINNPDDNIYLGLDAKVKLHVAEAKNVILVPGEAINTGREGTFCYVVENSMIVKKPVTTAVASDEYVEIIEGIQEGDSVVIDITGDIVEGMKVQALEKNALDMEEALLTQEDN